MGLRKVRGKTGIHTFQGVTYVAWVEAKSLKNAEIMEEIEGVFPGTPSDDPIITV